MMEKFQIYNQIGFLKARDIAQISPYEIHQEAQINFYIPMQTAFEGTNTYVTSFNSDGFSMNATDNEVKHKQSIPHVKHGNGKQMAEQHQQIVMAVLMLQYK